MGNNGLFGTGYGFKIAPKRATFEAAGIYTSKHEAKEIAAGLIKRGAAKQTRIEHIGGDYIVYYMPTAKNKKLNKGIKDYAFVDHPYRKS